MALIDISRDITKCEIYPGDPEVSFNVIKSMTNGDECNLAAMYSCLHNGTHADAPLHFIEKSIPIDKMPLDCFIGACAVLEVPAGLITGDYVERKFPRNVKRLLIKGRGNAYFHESAATEVASFMDIKLIGTDALSVGKTGSNASVHRAFLQNKIAILEGLDLSAVKPGSYYLFAQPIKIGGAEAAFVRAVLEDQYIFWSA